MKRAVISIGQKQYVVKEGDELDVPHISDESKSATINVEPLLVIDGEKTLIGKPNLSDNKVKLTIIEQDKKSDKTSSIRYKAKKRVHKVRGHRQLLSTVKVEKIS